MQIQKINTNKYSQIKCQQQSANAPSFGMRLVFDEETLRKFAGDDHIRYIEAAFENWGVNSELAARFKAVFAKIYEKSKQQGGNLVEPSRFNPRIIPGWDKIEVESSFRRNRKRNVIVELTHDKNSGIFAKGRSNNPDVGVGITEALDQGLDDLASKMIYEAIGI